MRSILPVALSALLCATASAKLDVGLTDHFLSWLNANGYSSYNFDRSELVGGAYGGKSSSSDVITHQPVVFIHGNSDIAVGQPKMSTDWASGFTTSIEYFLSKGYTKGELYITTWGDGNKMHANSRTHDKETLQYLRAFFEAVLEYTGAEKIDVITHSMGVTLGRRILKGGDLTTKDGKWNIGDSLASKVDSFVGIAGGNWGLKSCQYSSMIATCNKVDGYFPGTRSSADLSTYL